MKQKNPTIYPYPASEVNFSQNLPLISVSNIHPQLNTPELARLPESSMTPRATSTLPLPSSGPTCCSWTHPYPLLGHHPTFLRSLLLSCLKATLLHQAPQSNLPNPTQLQQTLHCHHSLFPYTTCFSSSLFYGLVLNYIFLFCPPFPSPLHMHALECKSYKGRAPGLIHYLSPLTYKTVENPVDAQ